MDHVTVSLAELLGPFRVCFARPESFAVFESVAAAWILCLRCRTLTEVWQLTGLGPQMHFDAIYSLFSSAQWDWDELGVLLCVLILTHLLPSGIVSIVVDDTLCHKRGKRVAFGGIFLDPVLSTKSRKILRYGLNYVVVALVLRLPFRRDRYYAFPILWRVYRKKGLEGHCKRTQLAAELIRHLADAIPHRSFSLVADSAYINTAVLSNLPDNVEVIGPLPKKAALYLPPMPKVEGQKGAPRKKGLRLPQPVQLLKEPKLLQEMADRHAEEFGVVSASNPEGWSAREQELVCPKVKKTLRVQTLRGVLWYHAFEQRPVTVALIGDRQEIIYPQSRLPYNRRDGKRRTKRKPDNPEESSWKPPTSVTRRYCERVPIVCAATSVVCSSLRLLWNCAVARFVRRNAALAGGERLSTRVCMNSSRASVVSRTSPLGAEAALNRTIPN